jgi:F0F1-type ATP synthase epsilon subunit
MTTFPFKLITPEGVTIDTSLWQISATNAVGRFAIRAQHIDFFTSLKPGELVLAYSPDKREHIQIESGFLEFKKECGCTVICEKKLS